VAVIANAVPDAGGGWGDWVVGITQVAILSTLNQVLARRARLLRFDDCGYSDDGENKQGEKHYSLHVSSSLPVGRRIFHLVQHPGGDGGHTATTPLSSPRPNQPDRTTTGKPIRENKLYSVKMGGDIGTTIRGRYCPMGRRYRPPCAGLRGRRPIKAQITPAGGRCSSEAADDRGTPYLYQHYPDGTQSLSEGVRALRGFAERSPKRRWSRASSNLPLSG
jgi:hypothetical protein